MTELTATDAVDSPGRVCGAQRTPCLPTAGTPGTDPWCAVWCEAENTVLADKASSVRPSDVSFHGLPLDPTKRHQVF